MGKEEKLPFSNSIINNLINVCACKIQDKITTTLYIDVDTTYPINNTQYHHITTTTLFITKDYYYKLDTRYHAICY
jgi:hypothetical protein